MKQFVCTHGFVKCSTVWIDWKAIGDMKWQMAGYEESDRYSSHLKTRVYAFCQALRHTSSSINSFIVLLYSHLA